MAILKQIFIIFKNESIPVCIETFHFFFFLLNFSLIFLFTLLSFVPAHPTKFCGRYKLEISVSVVYKKSTALKGGETAQGKMRNLKTQHDFCGDDLDTKPEV